MAQFRVLMKEKWRDRFWCDYVGCTHYSSRSGIQNFDYLLTTDEGKHFCSVSCREQAKRWKEKFAREKQIS